MSMMGSAVEPSERENNAWSPGDATDEIRAIARSMRLNVSYQLDVIDGLDERGLIVSDVLYILKYGFVYEEPARSTREGYNRYQMECKTPNSDSRTIRVIVIPDKGGCLLKIVDVLWVDEKERVAGSIIGE